MKELRFKAFTLVETLIVIVVFSIGILAVLHGLSQTLRNKDYAEIQIKSAFFAREGIELMFNLRDANYHKELPWNCIFKQTEHVTTIDLDENNDEEEKNPFCNGKFTSGTVLKIGIGSENGYINVISGTLSDDFDTIFSGYQIYFHTGNNILGGSTGFVYNHDSDNGEGTRFARYILIKGVTYGEKEIPEDKLLKVESHVLYKKGYLTGEKVMETFIGNYEFNQESGIQSNNVLDINGDGRIDTFDIQYFNNHCTSEFTEPINDENKKCDLNMDSTIDTFDFQRLSSSMGDF